MRAVRRLIAATSVVSLRRCPTSPESVPHFSGIRTLECFAPRVARLFLFIIGVRRAAERSQPSSVADELRNLKTDFQRKSAFWGTSPARQIDGLTHDSSQGY